MKTVLFSGIGRLGIPIVKNLADKDYFSVISYRTAHGSERAVKKLIETEGSDRAAGIAAEITELSEAENLVKSAIDKYGKVDALINIASGYPNEKDDWLRWQRGGQITDEDWQYYKSNFTLTRNVVLSLLKFTDDAAGLNIINFGDARSMLYYDDNIIDPYEMQGGIIYAGFDDVKKVGLTQLETIAPKRHINPYTLAKIDIAYLTRKLALDLGRRNVRVNAIAPGPIIPPPDRVGEQLDVVANQTALGKWGGEQSIVKAVEYLLGDDYVTGEILKVDGGLQLYQKFGPR